MEHQLQRITRRPRKKWPSHIKAGKLGIAAPGSKAKILSGEEQNVNMYSWLPRENFSLLHGLNDLRNGAGQIRLFEDSGSSRMQKRFTKLLRKQLEKSPKRTWKTNFSNPLIRKAAIMRLTSTGRQ